MAIISINPLNLTYKQYGPEPTPVQIEFSDLINSNLEFQNVPSWLKITDQTVVNDTTVTALFTVNTTVASALLAQDYTAVLKLVTVNPVKADTGYFNEGYLTVNLELQEGVLLAVTPNTVNFEYTLGDTTPTSKIVQITSENDWTVTKLYDWITLSTTSGSNNGSVTIGVDVTGLNTGTHSGTVTINDGVNTVVVNVGLVISDGNTVDDFLYVAPTELEFIRNIGNSIGSSSIISINSSDTWTASSSQSWLIIDKTTGGSGTDVINVTTDITNLTKGTYTGEISVVKGNYLRKVYVSLVLNEVVTEAPDNGGFYFADDDVELKVSSTNENSYLTADFTVEKENDNAFYPKKAPFIKGLATLNIGEETIDLIDSVTPPQTLSTQATAPITPIVIGFDAYEKDYYTGQTFETIQRNSLHFLNGKTPETENKICYIPSEITVTKKAVIAISILALAPPTQILIEGAISDTIDVSLTENTYTYTAFVNCANYNLKDLDVFTITFGDETVNVRIKEDDVESLIFAFENEWQLYELFEITGDLTITPTSDYLTQEYQEGNNVHERILKAKPGTNFTINTGWIESEEEVDWLFKVLDSKRMFLYINGEQIEVIPTFKNLVLYKTRLHQKSYKLTFKKAIL